MLMLLTLAAAYGAWRAWRAARAVADTLRNLPRRNDDMVFW